MRAMKNTRMALSRINRDSTCALASGRSREPIIQCKRNRNAPKRIRTAEKTAMAVEYPLSFMNHDSIDDRDCQTAHDSREGTHANARNAVLDVAVNNMDERPPPVSQPARRAI